MIKVNNINKYYNKGKDNEIHVINSTSFELPSVGLISFLGQSGSGKTTLLNVLGGLDKATGEISYDSLLIKDGKRGEIDKFRRKEIGYVFQNYNLLLDESVYNNLKIALEMINIYDEAEQAKRIEYVLKAVGMFKYRKKLAGALSGGQQQRVSIARALVKNSKIIIADEPTGNLDHENTINIMNILKKISKNTLVLVVTHNVEIASFYSDRIIEIKDGKIDNDYIPDSNSLQNKDANIIYLKDLERIDEDNTNTSISYYTDSKPKKIRLRIIEKNGSFYIDSNVNLKLSEGSNLKIVDKHYEVITKDNLDSDEYDTSFFKEDTTKKGIFSRIRAGIKYAFLEIKGKGKKTKALYASFILMGFLFGLATISFSNYIVIDKSNFQLDSSYYLAKDENYYSSLNQKEYVLNELNNDNIEALAIEYHTTVRFKYSYNFNEAISSSTNALALPYNGGKLLKGKIPVLYEDVIISKGLADSLIKGAKVEFNGYDGLIGSTIYLDGMYSGTHIKTICGISNNPYKALYTTDIAYLDIFANKDYLDPYSIVYKDYNKEKEADSYTIVEGRDYDIVNDINTNNVIINENIKLPLGSSIDIDNKSYTVVGKYVNKFKTKANEIIMGPISIKYDKYSQIDLANINTEYKLISGRDISSNNELLASVYSDYSLGEVIDINGISFTIVGFFNGSSETMNKLMGTRDALVYSSSEYYNLLFIPKGKLSEPENNSLFVGSMYEYQMKESREEQKSFLLLFGIMGLVLMTIIVIFIFFIMRSQMIQMIYPIGVYRSIGASKGRIYKSFIYNILVLVTLTTVVGYLATMLWYTMFTEGFVIIGILKNSLILTLSGLGLIYVLNIIFGLLPIVLLMQKTPAEILSKYDI